VSDNAVSRRLERVFSMSGDELVTRSRQELGKRIDGVLARIGHDFSETPRTTSSQPKFFFDPEEVPAVLAILKQRLPGEYNQIVFRAERMCQHRFDLLGFRDLDYGKEIDWSLDRVHGKGAPRKIFYKIRYLDFEECGDVKVTWELNRHQHLPLLAQAFLFTGREEFKREIFNQLESWFGQNPFSRNPFHRLNLPPCARTARWVRHGLC